MFIALVTFLSSTFLVSLGAYFHRRRKRRKRGDNFRAEIVQQEGASWGVKISTNMSPGSHHERRPKRGDADCGS